MRPLFSAVLVKRADPALRTHGQDVSSGHEATPAGEAESGTIELYLSSRELLGHVPAECQMMPRASCLTFGRAERCDVAVRADGEGGGFLRTSQTPIHLQSPRFDEGVRSDMGLRRWWGPYRESRRPRCLISVQVSATYMTSVTRRWRPN